MIVSRKIRLIPDKSQEQWLIKNSGVARFIYNWSLSYKIQQYKDFGISVNQSEIMNEITEMKYMSDYYWLLEYSSETIKQAVKDMLLAYNRFFKCRGFPRFKKRGRCKESFYVRYDRLYSIDNKHIKFPKLDKPLKISESCFITKGSIKNPRISFDGKYWYLTFSYEVVPESVELTEEILGVDLGITHLAILSNGVVYENINNSQVIKRLKDRLRKLQRKISRAYVKNINHKTNNIIKMEKRLRLLYRRLKNIRHTYIHKVTYEMVKTKPSTIVLENLGISNMMKNKYLSRSIQNQLWYFFRICIEYKAKFYGNINVILVPRNYPSSKMCSKCGNIKKFLSLSNRNYICSNCDLVLDRDLNASINLKNYCLI